MSRKPTGTAGRRMFEPLAKTTARSRPWKRFEKSAGGVVVRSGKLLMVKVRNLEGIEIWTFPKGHLEKGERAAAAALREVEEETGWKCRIEGPLEQVRYFFRRDEKLTRKTVTWFLMAPEKKTGSADPDEILATRWASRAEAARIVQYRSDKQLLKRLNAVIPAKAGIQSRQHPGSPPARG